MGTDYALIIILDDGVQMVLLLNKQRILNILLPPPLISNRQVFIGVESFLKAHLLFAI